MSKLTDKQEKVFFYLVEYIQRFSKWPTIREINTKFWFKSNRESMQYLEALEKKWCIKRTPCKYRGISLMNTDEHTIKIPILWTTDVWIPLRYYER